MIGTKEMFLRHQYLVGASFSKEYKMYICDSILTSVPAKSTYHM